VIFINKKSSLKLLKILKNQLIRIELLFIMTIVITLVLSYVIGNNFFEILAENQHIFLSDKIDSIISQAMTDQLVVSKFVKFHALLSENGIVLESQPQNLGNLNLGQSTFFRKIKELKDGQKLMFIYPNIFANGKNSICLTLKHNDHFHILMLEISKAILIPKSKHHVFILNDKKICIYSDLKSFIGERISSPQKQLHGFYYMKQFELSPKINVLILSDISLPTYGFVIVSITSILLLVLLAFKGRLISSLSNLIKELDVVNNLFSDFTKTIEQITGKSKIDTNKTSKIISELSYKVELLNLECQFEEGEKYSDMLENFIVLITDLLNEILASFQELQAFNEELENLTYRLENLNEKYELIMNFISEIDPSVELEEFMKKLLDIAIILVPEAEGGSVSLVENGKWRFIAAKNYDEDILKPLELKSEWMLKSDRNVFIVNNVMEMEKDKNVSTLPADVNKKLSQAIGTNPKSTIIGVLKDKNKNVLGHIALDILSGNAEFSDASINVMNFLIKLATSYLFTKKYYEYQRRYQQELVKLISKMLEMKDKYTKGHSERVARLSVLMAKKMGLADDDINKLYWASIVHDIGKMGIPDEILNKSTTLTEEEYEMIKKHPILAANLLEGFEHLKELSVIVKHHHERWDGNGYPDGLIGEKIPILSRIMALADAFDAMTSDRSYRKALSLDKTIKEIKTNAGKQFDPKIVEIFLEIVKNR